MTTQMPREKTCCRHFMGYSFRLAARNLLYAPCHRQDSIYHGLCYTSRGALAGTRLLFRYLFVLMLALLKRTTGTEYIASCFKGNVLFNDTLNTLYLRLYNVRHMVKDHSDNERGNPLPPHGLLLPISSKGSFICIIAQTG